MSLETMTTEQHNFCRAVEAMITDMTRRGKVAAWLIAHPGDLARTWGDVPSCVCGLRAAEYPTCPQGCFYLVDEEGYRRLEHRQVRQYGQGFLAAV